MSDGSQIQWTDATWNPTTGCTKVSPGCANCYIERTPAFRIAGRKFIKGATDLRLHADRLEQPLHWRKPRRVFVNSLSDLFHARVPDSFIDQVFAVMALAPQHTFQVLTKRAERMRDYCSDLTFERLQQYVNGWASESMESGLGRGAGLKVANGFGSTWPTWPLPNVWLGVSVENQPMLKRVDALKDTPAAVRFVSFEPLLEDLGALILDGIHWGIGGGESHGRPCNVDWIRRLVQEFARAGLPFFVKQLGSVPVMNEAAWLAEGPRRLLCAKNDKRAPLGTVPLKFFASKAGAPAEWDEDLRVRQFPAAVRE